MRITSAPAMTRSMWPTSSERTSSTSGVLLMWARSLAALGSPREPSRQMFGRHARYGGGGDGRHNKNVRSDRSADRSDKRQAASPRTSEGSIPLAFRLAKRRCNEGRMARRFEQPRLASPRSMPLLAPDRLAVTNEGSSLPCHSWRVPVRGRVTGAGVKVRGSITARPRRRSRTDRCHELTLHNAPASDSDDTEGLRSNVRACALCRRGRVSAPPIARRQSR